MVVSNALDMMRTLRASSNFISIVRSSNDTGRYVRIIQSVMSRDMRFPTMCYV